MGGGPSKYEKRAMRGTQTAMRGQQGVAGQFMDMAGQDLTGSEQAQMDLVGQGEQGAQQQVREQATSRGMFSSGGAIGAEAMIQQQLAQQRANIMQQAQQRQFQALGGAAGAYGGSGQSGAQMGNQATQASQGMMSNLMNVGKLAAAPFTGGASLGIPG